MTDIRDKYRILSTGAGWLDRRSRGRIRFDGADAAAFLHALVSNEVAALTPGRGVYAAYLTPQGRMVTDLHVHHRGDHLIAVVPAALASSLTTRLDQLIFAEDVRVSDVTAQTAQVAVAGARAAQAIEMMEPRVFRPGATRSEIRGISANDLESLATLAHAGGGGDTFVARSDDIVLPCYDVFVPAERRTELIAGLERAGAAIIDDDLWTSLRIDARRPEFGVDMTAETIPLEAGLLDRGISTSKGCYVGQEVIIRVLHRGGGRVAKRLVGLALDPAAADLPAPGATLHADGREVGRITSSAWSPHEPRAIALGYVHRDHAEPGRRMTVEIHDVGVEAMITGLAG
jgi:folate-binding protein YgfZ